MHLRRTCAALVLAVSAGAGLRAPRRRGEVRFTVTTLSRADGSSRPVRGARVRADGQTCRTGKTGRCTITFAPGGEAGRVAVTVARRGYAGVRATLTVR